MKKISLILKCCLWLWLMFSWALSYANETLSDLSVQAVISEASLDTGEETNFHFFTDQKITLSLIVKGKIDESFDLRARFYQVGFSLAAPIDQEIEILLNEKLHGDLPIKTSISLTLPAVQRETMFEFVYEVKAESQENWQAVGQTKIRAYPKNILDSLQAWSEHIQLKVEDYEGVLSKFLASKNIKFVDAKAESTPKNTPVVTMIVWDSLLSRIPKRSLTPAETYIIFYENVETLPKIIVEGRFVKVKMKIVNNLESDPLAQKAFLEIIKLINPSF